jgi:hypothetical protein
LPPSPRYFAREIRQSAPPLHKLLLETVEVAPQAVSAEWPPAHNSSPSGEKSAFDLTCINVYKVELNWERERTFALCVDGDLGVKQAAKT